MAPSAINEIIVENSSSRSRPTAYLLDSYHPAAITRAQELFNLVLPSHGKDWRQAEYLLVKGSKLSEEDIAICPNLKAIGKQGVGTDKIDANACSSRGIKVLNTPGVNSQAVAELVLTLTMSVARQVRSISIAQVSGEVIDKSQCSGLLLHRSTIGIVGMGNIGKDVAKIFSGAFSSQIIAFDPYMSDNAWSDIPHKRVKNVEELLKLSDVVTLHVPLTSSTRDLIGYEQMKIMKRSSILINAARGGIVNEEGLCRGLEDGLIWGAGLDCHEQEPPTKQRYERLWRHPNVVSLPHVGAATARTQMETAIAAVERLYEYATLSNSKPSTVTV